MGTGANEAQQIADLSLSVDSDRPRGLVAFTNARVITMNSARDVIDNGVVIVEDNRIVALGATGDVSIPDGARQVDLAGKTLMPGYIDAHAHGLTAGMTLSLKITGRSSRTWRSESLPCTTLKQSRSSLPSR